MYVMDGWVATQAGGKGANAGLTGCAVAPLFSVCHVCCCWTVCELSRSDVAVYKCGQL